MGPPASWRRQTPSRLPRLFILLAILVISFLHPIQTKAHDAPYYPGRALPHPGTLLVGGDSNYPPYEFLNDKGEPNGFNTDLTRALAGELGWKVEIVLKPWPEIRADFEQGRVDALQGMYYSDERARMFDFSAPHTIVYHSVFARRGSPPVNFLEDLQGKRLAVEQGDIMDDLVTEKHLSTQVLRLESQGKALEAVEKGEADYALAAKNLGLLLSKKLGLEGIEPVGPALAPRHYCYAVRKETHAGLALSINEGLAILHQNGEYDRIYRKWLAPLDQESGVPGWLKQYGPSSLAGLLGLALMILIWNWNLRRQIERRTRRIQDEMEERRRAEAALEESEDRFRFLAENIDDIFWLADPGPPRKVLYINPAYQKIWGLDPKDVYADSTAWRRALHQDDLEVVEAMLRDLEAGRAHTQGEFRMWLPDGEMCWVWVRVFNAVSGGGKHLVAGLAQDITQRKKSEAQLKETNRVLATVSACDQILVRASDETELLRETCRALVEKGGYPLAWAGFVQEGPDKAILPAAHAGRAEEYLAKIRLSWDAGRLEGQGPSGRALRTGRPSWATDIPNQTELKAFSRQAREAGLYSCVALPLFVEGMAVGVLCVYADKPNALEKKEIDLLEELAADLSYGISTFRLRDRQQRAEEELRESEARLKMVLDSLPVGVMDVILPQATVLAVNTAALNMLAAKREEVAGRSYLLFLPGEEGQAPDAAREMTSREAVLKSLTGRRLPVILTQTGLVLGGEEHMLLSFLDITQRKMQEEERERLIEDLESALGHIKTLKGLLPICASCKKVRDDRGYWHQIEAYVRDHSEAEFSHGICPECMKKLYPDIPRPPEDPES